MGKEIIIKFRVLVLQTIIIDSTDEKTIESGYFYKVGSTVTALDK